MVSWDKPFLIIRRQPGAWVKGEYVPSVEPAPEGVMGNIQPSRIYDYSTLAANAGGRRYAEILRFYTQAQLQHATPGNNGFPGDILIRNGTRYIILGVAEWRNLDGPTAHGRYLLVNELEHGSGEITA